MFRLPAQISASQEFQSAVIRLSILAFMLPMLGIARQVGNYDFAWNQFLLLFGVHLAWYLGLLISTLKRPGLWRSRTYLGILADLSGTTGTLFLTGDATGPFYLLYAVSFLSQGMRYGPTNLLIASVCSLLAFTFVAAMLGDWHTQTLEVSFVALVLVVLPAYEYSLLRRLRKAKQDAESANRARGDFLATMTHELRTPLSGVIGMSALLKRTRLDDEQRDYVDSINTSAGVLQSVIGDILDLSKIDAGKLELKVAPFALREAVAETCWALSNQALDKGLELIVRISPELPEQVSGDEPRFRQILFNLVGNAIKFTEHGHVRVSVQRVAAGDAVRRQSVCIEIEDTGIGIPADRVASVFDSFWQADPSSTRQRGGTGLGTAIARDLARLMGGDISVASSEGQGSTFRVSLPLPGVAGSTAPVAPATLAGNEVLVIEQNAESAEAIVEACEAAGMRVVAVVPGVDSIDPGLRTTSDAARRGVLVDDSPRGIDLERAGNLIRRQLGIETPIVYLHYPRRKAAFSDVAAARTFKPINVPQLWRAMNEVLAASGRQSREIAGDVLPFELPSAGRVLVAEDDAINAKLIASLLGKAGCDITLVGDGEQALQATRDSGFDLALVDLRMPNMDGIGFTRAYRAAEPAGRHMPIIALTANAAEETRAECLRAGMDDFATKPVDPERLQALLLRHGLACHPF